LKRLGKFNIFWVGQGNDALQAPHHTRDENDHDFASSDGNAGTLVGFFENGGRVRVVANDAKRSITFS
jgi:hypothetical protein